MRIDANDTNYFLYFIRGIRMYLRFWHCLIICIIICSCGENKFPDFTKTSKGLYYKLVDVGEGNKKAKPNDYVTAQIIIKSEKDSVLYDTRTIGLDGSETFLLASPLHEKDYREGFQYLSEGDSAIFITDAYTLYMKTLHTIIPNGMNLETPIYVHARVLRIRTPEEHKQDMLAEKEKLEQGEFEEKKILDKYLADSAITAELISNGMYYIKLQQGKGLTPDSGRVALLNYRGSFLNGRCFDFYDNQPFEYMVGQEKQLIKGLEIGVRRMREGEKAKFIIPSHLAFGSSGSSTGIVPPFTTVVYEVELLKVQ